LATVADLTEDSIALQGEVRPAGQEADIFIPGPPLEIVVVSRVADYAATVLRWPGGARMPTLASAADIGKVWWWGSGGAAVARIIKGYDNSLLTADTSQDGLNATAYFNARSVDFQMPLLLAVMPLQEAVYFTEYLGDVACGYDRFKTGPAGVGGAVNVMVITDEERTWLRRDRIQCRPTAV
jgi:hypothetical protein